MLDASFISTVNAVIVVLLALVGALVVAPDVPGQIYEGAVERFRLIFRRASPSATGEVRETFTVTRGATGHVWGDTETVARRFQMVINRIADVEGRLAAAEQLIRVNQQAQSEQLAGIGSEVEQIKAHLTREERRSTLLDARGIWPVFAGIALSAAPDWIAAWPSVLALLPPLAGLCVLAYGIWCLAHPA